MHVNILFFYDTLGKLGGGRKCLNTLVGTGDSYRGHIAIHFIIFLCICTDWSMPSMFICNEKFSLLIY